MTWIDTPWPQDPKRLKAGGYDIMRYLCSPWNTGPGSSMPHKRLERPELDSYLAAGVDVAVNFEDAADDYLGGYGRGKAKGQTAGAWMRDQLDWPAGGVCCSSIDADIGTSWGGLAQQYQQGFSDGLTSEGPYLPGIYGSSVALNGANRDVTAFVFWLTVAKSWSHGIEPDIVHMRQNGYWPYGSDADLNITVLEPIGSYLHPLGASDMTPDESQKLTDLWNWLSPPNTGEGQVNAGGTIAATLGKVNGLYNLPRPPTAAQIAAAVAKVPGEIKLTDEQLAVLAAELAKLVPPDYHGEISLSPKPAEPTP